MEAKRDGRPLESPVATEKLYSGKRKRTLSRSARGKSRLRIGPKLTKNPSRRDKIQNFLNQVSKGEIGDSTSNEDLIGNGDSIRALNHIFKITDDLEDVLHELLDGWDFPEVVVIGRENTVKSTILERLYMLPMFPRDSEVCARMVIRVQVFRACLNESIFDTRFIIHMIYQKLKYTFYVDFKNCKMYTIYIYIYIVNLKIQLGSIVFISAPHLLIHFVI